MMIAIIPSRHGLKIVDNAKERQTLHVCWLECRHLEPLCRAASLSGMQTTQTTLEGSVKLTMQKTSNFTLGYIFQKESNTLVHMRTQRIWQKGQVEANSGTFILQKMWYELPREYLMSITNILRQYSWFLRVEE